MTFSAVTYVDLEGRDAAAGLKMLHEILVPRLKELAGFQGARFLRSLDGKTGIGSVIFDTEGHAEACLQVMSTERPPDAPPVTSASIYEIVLEA
jgi:hypothetical protein